MKKRILKGLTLAAVLALCLALTGCVVPDDDYTTNPGSNYSPYDYQNVAPEITGTPTPSPTPYNPVTTDTPEPTIDWYSRWGNATPTPTLAQGGAIFTLADICFTVAANANEPMTVSHSAEIHYLRPGTGSCLYAEASRISEGRTTALFRVEVYDDRRRLVAYATVTGFHVQPR